MLKLPIDNNSLLHRGAGNNSLDTACLRGYRDDFAALRLQNLLVFAPIGVESHASVTAKRCRDKVARGGDGVHNLGKNLKKPFAPGWKI